MERHILGKLKLSFYAPEEVVSKEKIIKHYMCKDLMTSLYFLLKIGLSRHVLHFWFMKFIIKIIVIVIIIILKLIKAAKQ